MAKTLGGMESLPRESSPCSGKLEMERKGINKKICFNYHLDLVAGEFLQNKDNAYIKEFHSTNSQMLVGKELCHSH